MPKEKPQIDRFTAHTLDSMDPADRVLAARLAEARYEPSPYEKSWDEMTAQELADATIEASCWLPAARRLGWIK